jgi:hypothetical protein
MEAIRMARKLLGRQSPVRRLQVRVLSLPLLLCFLLGCSEQEPKKIIGVDEVNNPHFKGKVEVLFTDETGHTVHRFEDNGSTVYYVTPGPATASQHWTTSDEDKTIHHRRTVVTP